MRLKLLPTPKELGQPMNNLPSAEFGAKRGYYTWEDYDLEVKTKFPVRYWLNEALENIIFFITTWHRLSHIWYWIRTHTYRRYHIIDMRKAEPENKDGYKWGWIDRSEALTLVMFTVLREFVEKELRKFKYADLEQDYNKEILALYKWWTVDRLVELEHWESESTKYYERWKKDQTDEEAKIKWREFDAKPYEKEEEMLLRLLKVKNHMWT